MSHYCSSCGAEHAPDARFCEECGHAFDAAQQGPAAAAQDQPTQILPVPQPESAAPAGSDSNTRNLLVLGLALAAVLAAMTVLAVVLLRDRSTTTAGGDASLSPSPTVSPTPTPTVTKTKTPKATPTVTVTRIVIPDIEQRPGLDIPSSYKACGGGVYANGVTTCPFADAVASAWYASGGSTYLPGVYSPVTGRYYDMYCTETVPAQCTGGNNASVIIDYLPGE